MLLPRYDSPIVSASQGQCQAYAKHHRHACAGALCTGSFTDSRHTRSGFGELHLRAGRKASDAEQMFALGYLEGWLTAERIYDHFYNMRAFFNMTTPKPMQW